MNGGVEDKFVYPENKHIENGLGYLRENSLGTYHEDKPGGIQTLLHNMKCRYYPKTLEDIVCIIWDSINRNHIFSNGNKRMSSMLSVFFVDLNQDIWDRNNVPLSYEDHLFIFAKWSIILVVTIADISLRQERDAVIDCIHGLLYKGRIPQKHLRRIWSRIKKGDDEELKMKIKEANSVEVSMRQKYN